MSETENIYTGQCYCGATKVTVRGEPFAQGYCHCKSCRAFHGAPFMAWSVWPSDAVSVEGDLRKTDKNPALARSTCASCGGKMMGILKEAGFTVVFPNVLTDSGLTFAPTMHKYYADRAMDVIDGVPKFEDGPVELGGSGVTLPESREPVRQAV